MKIDIHFDTKFDIGQVVYMKNMNRYDKCYVDDIVVKKSKKGWYYMYYVTDNGDRYHGYYMTESYLLSSAEYKQLKKQEKGDK